MASSLQSYSAGTSGPTGQNNSSPWRQRAMGWLLLLALISLLVVSRRAKSPDAAPTMTLLGTQ
ncbi:hypothetical protein [Hymenobacter lucidus]|uniref:Uncharacterized protein n=1 Tax=Hymenobacter lucidus TaxID=2880930 RepID=A0ABS8AW31_9BACT|nr:hypothetical protein [Hymenobacter lucidus]MCB2410011.1 hypothetical protein [Hymenobacter lucidus]